MDEASGEALIKTAHELFSALGSEGIATVAAVNGLAFGGGCELAMACDVRVAARSATFGQPEIKLGIIPGFGGTVRLPRLVGRGSATEMNAIGDPVSADQALALGLVNEVVEDHELFDVALAWARRLAGQAPIALGQIKRLSALGEQAAIAAEQEGFRAAFESDDGKEGIAAFLGRRQPHFKGS
jgi:enoyl-CoA hydratase/3-hydroxyacyl-CoA dehydrogenase